MEMRKAEKLRRPKRMEKLTIKIDKNCLWFPFGWVTVCLDVDLLHHSRSYVGRSSAAKVKPNDEKQKEPKLQIFTSKKKGKMEFNYTNAKIPKFLRFLYIICSSFTSTMCPFASFNAISK